LAFVGDHPDREVVLVNNGSVRQVALEYLDGGDPAETASSD